jgi:hypothetical protein
VRQCSTSLWLILCSEGLLKTFQTYSKRPLLLADSEYANAKFLKATIGVEADLLMRLRPNRVLYGPPPAYSGKGRPRVHGARFALKEYQDWPQADQ